MKIFASSRSLILLAGLVIAMSPLGVAQTITDDFSNAGSLSGSTPDAGVGDWTTINSGSPSLTVSSNRVTIDNSSGEAAQLNFSASNLSTGTVYMGFTFQVDNSVSISTNNSVQAVAGFRSGTPASGTYVLSFGVFRPSGAAQTNSSLSSTTTNQVVAGLFTGTSQNASTTSLTGWGSTLDRGTDYRVVIGFDLDSDSASLWIDPASSSSTSITLSSITATARGVFLRQGAASHGQDYISNLRVSSDFDTAALTAVPEPSTYAGIFGVITLIGVVVVRRRQKMSM